MEKKEPKIILNRIRTPDGTVLTSYYRHDYVTYVDKNGHEYMVDGGNDYLRRNVVDDAPYTEMSVYDDAPFDVIRTVMCRGGRGKDGKSPLKWVPLCEMSDEWLDACILYSPNSPSVVYYKKEIAYRKKNKINISESGNSDVIDLKDLKE